MQWAWVRAFLAAAAAGALAATLVAALVPTPYRAEATFVVAGPAPTRELQLTYVDLARSRPVLDRASTLTGLPTARFEDDVRVVPAPQSLLIRVFATSDRKDEAAAMANAMTRALPAYLADSGLDEDGSLRLARAAVSARSVSMPLGAAAALGALAGLVVCWIAARLTAAPVDRSPHFESDLSRNPLASQATSDDSEITRINSVPGGHLDL